MRPDFKLRNDEMIYLDNAATTMIAEEVKEAMEPYLGYKYGNPATVYELGNLSKVAVEESRDCISDILKCKPEELFFTSGGTESNNWAIKGLVKNGKGIIVSAIEHPSVLESAKYECEREKTPYCVIPVDKDGLIDMKGLETELKTGKYALASIQIANNEIGTIQDVLSISKLCHFYGVVYHCDATQAFGKIEFDVDDVGADMISFSAHKIHGPMGVGALYVKIGTAIQPLLHGGGQEFGMRSGTLAVPEIVGFGRAAELACDSIVSERKRISAMVEWLASKAEMSLGAQRNGHTIQRLPNMLSITIPNIESEVVCGILNSRYNICVASCSACDTTKRRSHVLEAIGKSRESVLSTLRFSLSRFTSDTEIKLVFTNLQSAIRESKGRGLI